MLTRDGARLQVFLDIRQRCGLRRGPEELVILDELTVERPWGWVFFWNTRASRLGFEHFTLAGNAPYLVNRDGTMRFASIALGVEESIREYESELERQSGAWELFIHEPADCTLTVASGIRTALGLSVVELGALKRRLPCAILTGAYVDLDPVCQRLVAAGVRAEIRRTQRAHP
jgi:hypothetical protein